MSYRLSAEADLDLFGIFLESSERYGDVQADRYRASLIHLFSLLAECPEMARLRDELHPPIRVQPHDPYLIFYDVLEDRTVMIQRIRHARED